MRLTIPEAKKLGDKAKTIGKMVDAKFAALQAPTPSRPGMSVGGLIAAASQPRVDYREAISQIWDDTNKSFQEIENGYAEVDAMASFYNRCLWHVSEGSEIKSPELDPEFGAACRTLRRAYAAGLLSQQEVTDFVCRNRDDLRSALKEIDEQSRFQKRYRRATKRSLMAKTSATIDAILKQSGSPLTRNERARLVSYKKTVTRHEDKFVKTYRKQYYSGKSYRPVEEMPGYNFSSLRGLT